MKPPMTLTEYEKWTRRKVRICRTMHECELCSQKIQYGDEYRDGGYGKRAHTLCVQLAGGNK